MDAEKINMFLHSGEIPKHYKVKEGDTIKIVLPRVPLTRFTEYLQLEKEKHGDVSSFIETPVSLSHEGSLLPTEIRGKAVSPGKVEFILRAIDTITGREVPNVEPLDIILEIQAK